MPSVTVKITVPRRGTTKGRQNTQVVQRRTYWLNLYDLERSTAQSFHELALRKAKNELRDSATYELRFGG